MYQLTKEIRFEAAHRLPHHDGQCARLHGHSFKARIILKGDIPTPLNKPSGCGFRTRCPLAQESCANAVPELRTVGNGTQVACPIVNS